MIERDNYYIMLELDPAVRDVDSIEKAIKTKQDQWTRDRGLPPPMSEKAKQGLDELKNIRMILIDDPQARNSEAEAAKKILLSLQKEKQEKLRQAGFLLIENGEITEKELSKLAKDFKLPESEILKSINAKIKKDTGINYQDDGIVPLDPTDIKNITNHLNIVKKNNLFDFLECPPSTSCHILLEKADEAYVEVSKNANKTADVTAKTALASLCKTWFKNESCKKRYEKTLRLEIFNEIYKMVDIAATEGFITNVKYQNLLKLCLEKNININEAEYRIHDYCAKKKNPPKILRTQTNESTTQTQCGFCGYLNQPTHDFCENCGNPLKINCPKCDKSLATSNNSCPNCGFLICDMPMANPLIRNAKIEFKLQNYEKTSELLAKAEIYNPKHPDIEPLKKEMLSKIDEKERIIMAASQKVDDLITKKMLFSAQIELDKAIEIIPIVRVEFFRKIITSTIYKAQNEFDSLSNFTGVVKADKCLEILSYCNDFEPAVKFLQNIPLSPVKTVKVEIIKDNMIHVSWVPTNKTGVTYTLIRKKGEIAPIDIRDGEFMKHDIQETSFIDESAVPGNIYTYAIFAQRFDKNSPLQSSNPITFSTRVLNLNIEQSDSIVCLVWENPKNCVDVTISRVSNGEKITLEPHYSNKTFYKDENITFGQKYTYQVIANFSNTPSLSAAEIDIIPNQLLKPFEVSIDPIADLKYTINWDIPIKNIDVFVKITDLVQNNTTEFKTFSDKKSIDIQLQQDSFYSIQVLAPSGNKYVSTTKEINTFTSCYIDEKNTFIEEKSGNDSNKLNVNNELIIKLSGEIPDYASEFWYFVHHKPVSDIAPPWVDENNYIKAPSGYASGTVDIYKKYNEFLYPLPASDKSREYYITIYTIYQINQKKVISTPSTHWVSIPLRATIEWKVIKKFLRQPRLILIIKPNRIFYRLPKFTLTADKNDAILSKPEIKFDTPEDYFDKVETKGAMKIYTKEHILYRQFNKNSNFTLQIENEDKSTNYKVLKAIGFSGKVVK